MTTLILFFLSNLTSKIWNHSSQVTVRCKCKTLKKEWVCQDVQAAYNLAGCHPMDIPKIQFGVGLIPCNSDCKSTVQVVESELQLRKTRVTEVIMFPSEVSTYTPNHLFAAFFIFIKAIKLDCTCGNLALVKASLCLHCHLR